MYVYKWACLRVGGRMCACVSFFALLLRTSSEIPVETHISSKLNNKLPRGKRVAEKTRLLRNASYCNPTLISFWAEKFDPSKKLIYRITDGEKTFQSRQLTCNRQLVFWLQSDLEFSFDYFSPLTLVQLTVAPFSRSYPKIRLWCNQLSRLLSFFALYPPPLSLCKKMVWLYTAVWKIPVSSSGKL